MNVMNVNIDKLIHTVEKHAEASEELKGIIKSVAELECEDGEYRSIRKQLLAEIESSDPDWYVMVGLLWDMRMRLERVYGDGRLRNIDL